MKRLGGLEKMFYEDDYMRKGKKNVKDLVGVSFLGAAGSVALGGLGGAPAVSGQAGLANMASFAPAMGSVMGAGMMMGAVRNLEPKNKKKKNDERGWLI